MILSAHGLPVRRMFQHHRIFSLQQSGRENPWSQIENQNSLSVCGQYVTSIASPWQAHLTIMDFSSVILLGVDAIANGHEPNENHHAKVNPEPRTDAHNGGNGHEDENARNQCGHWHREPKRHHVREIPATNVSGEKCNSRKKKSENEEPSR